MTALQGTFSLGRRLFNIHSIVSYKLVWRSKGRNRKRKAKWVLR